MSTANKTIKNLKGNKASVYLIHYSSEALSDENDGLTPRITSIAALHFATKTMHSFSLHLVAEKEGIAGDKIDQNLDLLESKMLEEYFSFVGSHQENIWIHWNMNNINFGFEVLEHRMEVLNEARAPRIPDLQRLNLSDLIV